MPLFIWGENMQEYDANRMKYIENLFKECNGDDEEFLTSLCDIDGKIDIYFDHYGAGHCEGNQRCTGATYRLNPQDVMIKVPMGRIRSVITSGCLVDINGGRT